MNFNIIFILNLCLISKCTATSCTAAAPTISNGWRSYSSTSATYYCNTGYEGSGNATIDCQYSFWGNYWPSVNYTCTIKDCGTPSTISNGYRSYSATTYASAATYYCNTGYVGIGSSSIICQSSGTWSALAFSCLRDCGIPSTISNGARSYSATTHGSTATYSCNTGYLESGTNSITCQSSGSWSALTFSCALRDCGTPPSISNGARSYTTTTYLSVATYSCNVGYSGTGTNTITCLSSGSWSSLSYSCVINNCGTPPSISNGARSYTTTTYLSVATYSCNVGYSGTGTITITCLSSGSWSSLSYSCAINNCGTPPSISNGARSYTTTTYLSVATYSCNVGYSGTGTNTITCQSSGSWSSLSYSCALDSSSSPATSSMATSAANTTTEENLEDNGCDERYRLMRNIIFGFIAVIVLLLNTYL